MAKMACYCGASMSNSDCPSENIIYVVNKDRVDSAIKYNPQITLIDFITNWDVLTDTKKPFISDNYDFWYCTKCKRVYQTEIQVGGDKLAAYVFEPKIGPIDKETLFSMRELVVFTDIEEDTAIESNPSTLLVDFVSSLSCKRFFISEDSNTVYAYDCTQDRVIYGYQSESPMDK